MKVAKSIIEYVALRWIDENFYPGAVSIEKIDGNEVTICDRTGTRMTIEYDSEARVFYTD